jgi:ubiquinone/menaquinone biosynthesis C-methylase UbiE
MSFKTFFSEQARKPSGLFGRLVMSRIFDKGNAVLNDFMKDLLLLQRNDYVLEIGFGTGKMINEMAKLVDQGLIEGVDFSSTMVALAEKKNKKHIIKGRVKITHGNFEEMAYDDNSFDKICSVNTIYFWPNPEYSIKKILSILKPGGKLVLGIEDKSQMEKKPLSTNVFRIYCMDDVEHLLTSVDFSVVEIKSKEVNSLTYHCAIAIK